MDSVDLFYLAPTLTSLWKPSTRSPHKWWSPHKPCWPSENLARLTGGLVVSMPAELTSQSTHSNCSSDMADRTYGFERRSQGACAKCIGVCMRVTKWSRSYFQKNRDTCFCLLFFHVCFCLYLCTLEFFGIWFPSLGALVFSTFGDVSLWVALPEPFLESSVLHPGMWCIGSLTRLFPLLHVLSAQVPNWNYIHVYIKGK